MPNANPQLQGDSPFHRGEQELQTRIDRREAMEVMGRQIIRTFMPEQHRQFYESLPFMVVGGVDDAGWPWASLLAGRPGFIQSPDDKTLDINSCLSKANPLASSVKTQGSPLGLLGIEMMTRRRNRMNGRIHRVNDDGFSVRVDQSFGNCPQYIQNWDIDFIREPGCESTGRANKEEISEETSSDNAVAFTVLNDEHCRLIREANTFFVSSYIPAKERPENEGVDVSHRGGQPGFVKVEGNTLTIPDYPGNNAFNTLGNFLINPKAGLVFIDFASGDMLMLTGTVELLWEKDEDIAAFKGAERAWRFTLDHGVQLKDALPFRATLEGYSPNTLMTGDWSQAQTIRDAQAQREAWLPYKIARIEDESESIRSFYLEPVDAKGLLPYEAGQFLTLRIFPEATDDNGVIRTYTLSSLPHEPYYRISIKKEGEGYVSRFFHDELDVGDTIEAKAPTGDFYINVEEKRPAVLLGGGVGITPMISMASHVLKEGLRTRHLRPLTIFYASKTTKQRAFHEEFLAIEQQSQKNIRYFSFISEPEDSERIGVDFSGSGRITADVFRQTLPLDDYDFYLCGPPGFMQTMYDEIRTLGVRDARIFAEAFGPASLKRTADEGLASHIAEQQSEEADAAVIKFVKADFEQGWHAGDATLLETAEAHGLTPNFGCRNGSCGSCATKLKEGAVVYRNQPTADCEDDEVLICCAVPAKGSKTVALDL